MPELPEVETVVNILKTKVNNKEIRTAKIIFSKLLKNTTIPIFLKMIENEKIHDVKRRGKHIIFCLTNIVIVSHLRMEGKYTFYEASHPKKYNKHAMAIFYFNDGSELEYHDTRKFGTMHAYDKNEFSFENFPTSDLGLEPWDKKLTTEYLKNQWCKIKKPIKATLLEQNVITGIGNIYADEILFKSNIHPLRESNSLDDNEIKKIIENTKIILSDAIEQGGTTIMSFSHSNNISGRFQTELKAYGRKNLPCLVCGTKIERVKIAGRSTCYCPSCQPK